jgi:hypothetical protein
MPVHGDIEMGRERVRQAELLVLRQRKILLKMSRRGDATGMAEDLLETYERILADYRIHLALLLDKRPQAPF